jgi:hypothetical protein
VLRYFVLLFFESLFFLAPAAAMTACAAANRAIGTRYGEQLT